MFFASIILLALAATGFTQAPEGYRKVLITSMVDPTYVVVPKSATSGAGLVVQKRNDMPEQHWYIKSDNTTIQLANTTPALCVDAGAKTNWRDMGSLSVKPCNSTERAQAFTAMADGRIALTDSNPKECIDLQYMRATPNNPVGLYACAGLGNTGANDKGINWPLVDVTS
ncbi:hypothetical protein CC78DRAFT_602642 [Lojkania enalia]|uniref:Ricin B lectin domain-containing protein n=1 Tax=Lojkania enalia TaxID=147567 RepID=A0A9P4K8G1_9PLEO|nr:hypothetical protein CC78DRAFT_602642 [Didymosphaeria enalia]